MDAVPLRELELLAGFWMGMGSLGRVWRGRRISGRRRGRSDAAREHDQSVERASGVHASVATGCGRADGTGRAGSCSSDYTGAEWGGTDGREAAGVRGAADCGAHGNPFADGGGSVHVARRKRYGVFAAKGFSGGPDYAAADAGGSDCARWAEGAGGGVTTWCPGGGRECGREWRGCGELRGCRAAWCGWARRRIQAGSSDCCSGG